ncbi:hypothetical protein [Pseudomonas koreensis]|uniref:hypothetical protein n=1 Tax=Pseudomonas koreensis TaxID=198620 RepID=UPI0014754C6A|nr:hypothetical protein [Pseudomonas koreensis]NNA58338.1 hypothetical protein [Pseudomonas koreensis]
MTPQQKSDAQQRGYEVRYVSATTDNWWQVYRQGAVLDDRRFGTEDEGWRHAVAAVLSDQYNH